MATTTDFSPETRYLPLWTWDGRRRPVGRMHLARVKTTKKESAIAWCGRRFFVDPRGPKTVTGEVAALMTAADEQPTCQLCLDRVGAWGWEW